MNLCINARDAMPTGGTLSVLTENFFLHRDMPAIGSLQPGYHVILTVTDTGTGMEATTIERIFEPFFTTKELDKGTGLGLAMVANIVEAAHGHIAVNSRPDEGTTFQIYWPASSQNAFQLDATNCPAIGGTETILVVDDEETLRYLAKDMLESYGYRVLLAADGLDALEVYKQYGQQIAIILLDVVMPQMSGRELYHKLLEINPGIKIVLASGYFPPEELEEAWTEGIMGFVQKPYQIEDLAAELRLVLDGKN
jgi:CheY-like chemotaxis protein